MTEHKPFTDDGVTYCGWGTDTGVHEGCGELWPCSTVLARRHCPICGAPTDAPCVHLERLLATVDEDRWHARQDQS